MWDSKTATPAALKSSGYGCVCAYLRKPLVLAPLLSGTLSHLTVDPVNCSVLLPVCSRRNCLTLLTPPSPCHLTPLIRLQHMALYKFDWLIDWLIENSCLLVMKLVMTVELVFFVFTQKIGLQHFILYAHGPDLCHDLNIKHALANCFEAVMGICLAYLFVW